MNVILEVGPNLLTLGEYVLGVGVVAYLIVQWWTASTRGRGRD